MTRALTCPVNETAERLKARTAAFARAVIKVCNTVVATQATRTITAQLIDSATSVAANYRAACRARSQAEFVAKIGVVAEEADESEGWLKMLLDLDAVPRDAGLICLKEAGELTAIASASYRTAKCRLEAERRGARNKRR